MRKYIFLGLGLLALSAPLVVGAVAITSPMASTNLADALNTIINVCLKIVLPLATIVILVAAFFIVRAGGDSEKLDKGKKMLIAGLGGLAIVILGAGSGVLLKNIFKIQGEIPGVTYALPSAYGLDVYTAKDAEEKKAWLLDEIAQLQQQIVEAEKSGDTAKVESLKKELAEFQAAEKSVRLYGEYLLNNLEQQSSAEILAIYNAAHNGDVGKAYLKKYGIKDANGYYEMEGGAKYNPETKEFIDASGNVYKDASLLIDGSVETCTE